VSKRGIVKDLAKTYNRSVDWIRKELRAYELATPVVIPANIIAVMDCVFFGRTSGYLVVRDPHKKVNVYWSKIERETLDEYQCARDTLEAMGFTFAAVVIDGKPGVRTIFADLPVQMCQFHQMAIVTRHLTRGPKLEAGRDLRDIVLCLPYISEECFRDGLNDWHQRWKSFVSERTTNPNTGRWHYTHKRLRSAYRSLRKNFSFLFTYRRHQELKIPNTTNPLDGTFTHLKGLVKIHRGMKPDLKHKMILSILQNRHRKN